MIRYKIKIGNGTIEAELQDMKSAHKFGAVYGMIPDSCSECKSSEIFLSHKSPGGNDYYTIRCKSCGAELTLHQKKEGGFYITAEDKFKKYVPQEDGKETSKNKDDFEDDVPF